MSAVISAPPKHITISDSTANPMLPDDMAPPPPIPSCTPGSDTWCGVEDTERERISLDTFSDDVYFVRCSLCNNVYHFGCVRDTFPPDHDPGYGTTREEAKLERSWCCRSCIEQLPSRMNQFILINAQAFSSGRPCYFPAEILQRRGSVVTLRWSLYNEYPEDLPPPQSETFRLTASECYAARFRDTTSYFVSDAMGGLRCPVAFYEEAVDMCRYQQEDMTNTLRGSVPSIESIILGKQGIVHPIAKMWDTWIRKGNAAIGFPNQFRFPLFPADLGLKEHFQYQIERTIRHEFGADEEELVRAQGIGSVLFCVVMARVALGCSPCHDLQVFYLAYAGNETLPWAKSIGDRTAAKGVLHRAPSQLEQANQASFTPPCNTRSLQYNGNGRLKLRPDSSLPNPTYANLPISVLKEDGSSFHFATVKQSGLGNPISLSPNTTSQPPGPRPRPRPLGKRVTPPDGYRILELPRTDDGDASGDHLDSRKRSTPPSPSTQDMPASKKKCTYKPQEKPNTIGLRRKLHFGDFQFRIHQHFALRMSQSKAVAELVGLNCEPGSMRAAGRRATGMYWYSTVTYLRGTGKYWYNKYFYSPGLKVSASVRASEFHLLETLRQPVIWTSRCHSQFLRSSAFKANSTILCPYSNPGYRDPIGSNVVLLVYMPSGWLVGRSTVASTLAWENSTSKGEGHKCTKRKWGRGKTHLSERRKGCEEKTATEVVDFGVGGELGGARSG
ncbi:hypothetical protein BKA70DRAFT_1217470 [Coprinopsis sp. MPI-PUGE-AT-0042]|nr:hypothetical protein BKA70DRAFT_1217470 [Coprinopsis sp. MPI-PUGE-AT-0042]